MALAASAQSRICLRPFGAQLFLPLIATHASLRLRVNLLPHRFKHCSLPNEKGPHVGALCHLVAGARFALFRQQS